MTNIDISKAMEKKLQAEKLSVIGTYQGFLLCDDYQGEELKLVAPQLVGDDIAMVTMSTPNTNGKSARDILLMLQATLSQLHPLSNNKKG